jgi:hypothetical protein
VSSERSLRAQFHIPQAAKRILNHEYVKESISSPNCLYPRIEIPYAFLSYIIICRPIHAARSDLVDSSIIRKKKQ